MIKFFPLVLAGLLILPEFSKAEDRLTYVLCRNKKIVRTIRVNWSEKEQSCITKYTKQGVDKVIGEGKFFESCMSYLNNVKGNLEKANWECRDISDAKVHEARPIKSSDSVENG